MVAERPLSRGNSFPVSAVGVGFASNPLSGIRVGEKILAGFRLAGDLANNDGGDHSDSVSLFSFTIEGGLRLRTEGVGRSFPGQERF